MICSAQGCGGRPSAFLRVVLTLDDDSEHKVALPIAFCESHRYETPSITPEVEAQLAKFLPEGRTLKATRAELVDVVDLSGPPAVQKAINSFGQALTLFDQIDFAAHMVKSQAALRVAETAIGASRTIRSWNAPCGAEARTVVAESFHEISVKAQQIAKALRLADIERAQAHIEAFRAPCRACGEAISAMLLASAGN